MPDSLGDRMKGNYENCYKIRLPRRMPLIVRLDMKCGHTFTRGMEAFDAKFIEAMQFVAYDLCKEVSTCQLAYVQSDEISLLLHNYKKIDTEAYFDNELQKLCSVIAGFASASMSLYYNSLAVFDCRVFVLPEAEVNNYFIWRQQDAVRNSIQMLAQSMYSPKELHGKKEPDLHELIYAKGKNWNNLPITHRRGSCVVKQLLWNERAQMETMSWHIDNEIPIFSQDREYIERLLVVDGEEKEK